MRYELNTNSFKKYMPVTIATNVSEKSVAAIEENKLLLQGIDVLEDSVRKYIDDVSMGPVLGYTGKASAEELESCARRTPVIPTTRSSEKQALSSIWSWRFRAPTAKKP